ncbi:MAG: transglycosylase domain-containing protein, partial [Myxococcota bacterium]|nr:transglycosylase domain-containing protein [Myxococcota bacterium]
MVLARDGEVLRVVADPDGNVSLWRELDAISPKLIAATIHAEDKRFHNHMGVDPIAILRSGFINLRAGTIKTGASTITQQTVGLMPRGREPEGRWARKIDEAILALALERSFSKAHILAHYLNRAPYGHRRVGVEAAARYYLGVSARELTWAQAAFLASLPRAPSRLSDPKNRALALAAQRQLLETLHRRGVIDRRAYEDALGEVLEVQANIAFQRDAMHVSEQMLARHPERDTLRTTIDLDLQREVSHRLREHVTRHARDGISQAAALVLDTQTGEVLAWVGSRDYFHKQSLGANDGVTMRRRPGSTLKPFVYARYLVDGGTLADPLTDLPTHLKTERGAWAPQNFDHRFHGPVSVREALASSLNVPAVLIANSVGLEPLIQDLRALGFPMESRAREDYGLGLALGNAEVSLLELAVAYATFGRGGRWRPASLSSEELAAARSLEEQRYTPEVAF